MHTEKANRRIMRQIEKITDTIKSEHTNIELLLSETQDKIRGLSKQYLPQYAAQQENIFKEAARESAASYRADAIEDIEAAFEEIRASISEWVSTPIPEGAASLISSIRDYGLTLSAMELLSLSLQCSGSYFGMRALATLAKEQKIAFPNFETLDTLLRMVTLAENQCKNAVNYYVGPVSPDHHLETWLLPDTERHSINTGALAADFLSKEDSSFTRMTKRLLTLTDPEISLLPSERDRIAKMFESCETEDQKVEKMLRLIENPHTSKADAGALKLYDKDLYYAALKLKHDTARIAAKAVEDAVREKQIEALKARTATKEAAAQLADAQQ